MKYFDAVLILIEFRLKNFHIMHMTFNKSQRIKYDLRSLQKIFEEFVPKSEMEGTLQLKVLQKIMKSVFPVAPILTYSS